MRSKKTVVIVVFVMLVNLMILAFSTCGTKNRTAAPAPARTPKKYPAGKVAPEVAVDLGSSELYTQEERNDAVLLIKDKFATFDGCELHSIRYAGDEAVNEENLTWLNSLAEGAEFTQVAEFLSDFHSPVEEGPYAWEIDMEYKDYQWWLARKKDGAWKLVSWGY